MVKNHERACLFQLKEVVLKCKNNTTKSLARALGSFKGIKAR
jgi:hypothetical protein